MAKTLQLQPALGELFSLVAYIECFAEMNDLPPAQTMAFSLAAEELFANTINHSKPSATAVDFSMQVADENLLAVYKDDAPPFNPTEQAAPDMLSPAADREIGGLGIHLVRKTMPTFLYARENGQNIINVRPPSAPASQEVSSLARRVMAPKMICFDQPWKSP